MKNYILILFSLILTISYAQKEKNSDLKVRDGIFNANFTSTTKITDQLFIEKGISVGYNFDAMSLELPLHFKYKINQKLSFFAGPSVYTTRNINRYGNLLNSTGFGSSAEIGLQYDFNENAYAKFFYRRNFNVAENSNLGINDMVDSVNFKFGYRF
ncbi:hypothetical protein FF125_00465 [Aureibaculum algae]|uniref:Outer membrane protein beta-barrel domain-containing protein n=1 Tax=Aureibaculum algae TaxID=2584122 RepID=A0A5B7TLF0_9FLAO|nr:hypothetical protein [Aureibaculum algae]QCX36978.1 hypothetical protein FF125_00465 [Aureibaculum algae]